METLAKATTDTTGQLVYLGIRDHHPQSRYYDCPPDLSQFKKGFQQDPAKLVAVTRHLLQRDFGLKAFTLPLKHLCPPVPQRLSYIHWVHDLLQLVESKHDKIDNSNNSIIGVDVGVGASAIFPLLGHQQFGWHFVGTDIDKDALVCAQRNIDDNKLQDKIRVVYNKDPLVVYPQEQLFDDEKQTKTKHNVVYAFSMCNPPFFEDVDSETGQNRGRATNATAGELCCPGGEYGFITRMIEQSVCVRDRIGWFTTMVGKKATLDKLINEGAFRDVPFTMMKMYLFRQGVQSRWGLAWTFWPERTEE